MILFVRLNDSNPESTKNQCFRYWKRVTYKPWKYYYTHRLSWSSIYIIYKPIFTLVMVKTSIVLCCYSSVNKHEKVDCFYLLFYSTECVPAYYCSISGTSILNLRINCSNSRTVARILRVVGTYNNMLVYVYSIILSCHYNILYNNII